MNWDEEQRKKLFEDYDAGKITKEAFNEKVAILDKLANNAKKHETSGSPKRLMIIVSSVILGLSVVGISAYFIFRDTPEKEAQRLFRTMEAIKTEADKRMQPKIYEATALSAIAEMRNLKAAFLVHRALNIEEFTKNPYRPTRVGDLVETYLDDNVALTYRYEIIPLSDVWFLQLDAQNIPLEIKVEIEKANLSQKSGLVGMTNNPYRATSDRYILLPLSSVK